MTVVLLGVPDQSPLALYQLALRPDRECLVHVFDHFPDGQSVPSRFEKERVGDHSVAGAASAGPCALLAPFALLRALDGRAPDSTAAGTTS